MMERSKRIAVIRIRGVVEAPQEVIDTLYLLRLRKTNVATVIDDRKEYIAMLKKVEPYVTWGEIDKETFKKLLLKRGRLEGDRRITEESFKEATGMTIDEFIEKFFNFEIDLKDVPKLKPFFRLRPPKKGYGRKGIKVPYKLGGAYGYRGEAINDLLLRMI